MKKKLFILDDDQASLSLLHDFFTSTEMEVVTASDGATAIERIRREQPQVAILDINLPGKSGLDILEEMRKWAPRLPIIMMTGANTTQNAVEAMKKGAFDFLTKPLDLKKLEAAVTKALQSNSLSRDLRYLGEAVPAAIGEGDTDLMIGTSPEMIEIWKMVGKVADTDATVLIQGESGTGKELLARAIYFNSRRKNRPFLAVNCAALPESLLESELFGHEKGAFTDASTRRIGKFEQCNGGTLFLDEVGEMSPVNQGKLLRVLENQEFERVGGHETIKVDVRIIAATNRSLVEAVRDKRLRMDLFYRLKVISFFLPPLRERPEDIPLLADLFIRRIARKYGQAPRKLAPEALQLLVSNPWKGNIRELKHAIDSASLLTKSDTLTAEDFAPLLHSEPAIGGAPLPSNLEELFAALFTHISRHYSGAVYDSFIREAEQYLFRLAMERNNDNQVHAAKFLGISRNTLRDRLKRMKGSP